jgi:hypothetical protein
MLLGVDCTLLAQGRYPWWASLNTVMNESSRPVKAGHFLAS